MVDKDRLYETYHPKVYAYLISSVKNQHTAEDLCSEVFLKIYRRLETFDETKSALSTWIYTITKNTLYDYYRTNHPSDELNEEMEADEELDERILYDDELKALAAALMQLDETERKIIIYKYYKHKTLQEIATALNISLFRVWSIHKKSLTKIREIMQPEQKNEK